MDKLTEIFNQVFNTDVSDRIQDLSPENFPNWDSLGHLHLVTAIEDEWDIELEIDQINAMKSYADIVKTLKDLGVQ
ncbi:MAG: acyl carrier protein [Bacteriovoracaceae bacterium]